MDLVEFRKRIEEKLKIFDEFKETLTAQLEKLRAERKRIDEEIAQVEHELKGLDARFYGKKPEKRGTRKTGIRQSVLNVISSNPAGINRSGILDVMQAKGNKAQEQAVSNALAALKKSGVISATDGKYTKA